MVEFDSNLFTHVEEMDKQYIKLVELLNNTYELLKEDRKEKAAKLFEKEFLAYVEYNLSEEEKFMEEIGYPELEQHRKIHEVFRREICNLAPHIENGDLKAFREVLALAWGWLYNHIAKTDKKYGVYAKEVGIDLKKKDLSAV
jgi:hemerythrin